ncbi:MAG: Glycine/D-amino acid oxidase deaminating [Rhodobacteraceae bacterium]|uniref:NAD(P)/FAD-dependent oxidoreductase n=1 Tax=Cypionkella sp. TaxID=2811411 RepID=UPI001324C0EF|nr:FAD-binding oxidoreductase [Cypionkella sp.]KAF0171264.1 MAG: Glycine/D-amino acid oxidase deaminating [Paracoccaceae bacterium]MDO8327068.1 FAD-binding oxidoreductase [Cypionkella sp.]
MIPQPSTDYADVWYRRQAPADLPLHAPLQTRIDADICIIGGGLAGLTAAYELARAGRNVVLVEARRIGWGASGRNGGFVSPGYSLGYDAIAARVGTAAAKDLFQMSIEGMRIVADNITCLGINAAAPCPGILGAVRYDAGRDLMDHRDWLAREFDYQVAHLDRAALGEHLTSPRYHQALHDQNAFHFDPLAYCLGLARAAMAAGSVIHEATPADKIEGGAAGWTITTPQGRVSAREVVVTTGGYTDRLVPQLHRAFLPIATYVMISRAAPDLIASAIHTRSAIGDDRRAGDYYRLVDDGKRVLWGGKITTRTTEPRDLGKLLHQTMTDTYPQLAGLQTDTVWTGLMSYARHRMPQIGKLASGLWHCTAFGGHGMNTTAIGGRVIAEAMLGQSDRYRRFAPFGLDWTGGLAGMAAVQLTYWRYQAMDAWRERKG